MTVKQDSTTSYKSASSVEGKETSRVFSIRDFTLRVNGKQIVSQLTASVNCREYWRIEANKRQDVEDFGAAINARQGSIKGEVVNYSRLSWPIGSQHGVDRGLTPKELISFYKRLRGESEKGKEHCSRILLGLTKSEWEKSCGSLGERGRIRVHTYASILADFDYYLVTMTSKQSEYLDDRLKEMLITCLSSKGYMQYGANWISEETGIGESVLSIVSDGSTGHYAA